MADQCFHSRIVGGGVLTDQNPRPGAAELAQLARTLTVSPGKPSLALACFDRTALATASCVRAIVDRVNGLRVDMVAVTGDLVDGSVADLAANVAPVAALTSRHGSFFVTGNHECYSGAHAWIAELRRLDITVLLDEHVVLRHGESEMVVAGVTDHSAHHFDASHRSDPRLALDGRADISLSAPLRRIEPRNNVGIVS